MSGLETHGLEQIPEAERTAKTRELFPTWVAANISVLLLTMGAGLSVSYGLDFWQILVVGATAPIVSYGLVGLIGIAGKRGGAPGMALSRAVFGQRGNLLVSRPLMSSHRILVLLKAILWLFSPCENTSWVRS